MMSMILSFPYTNLLLADAGKPSNIPCLGAWALPELHQNSELMAWCLGAMPGLV